MRELRGKGRLRNPVSNVLASRNRTASGSQQQNSTRRRSVNLECRMTRGTGLPEQTGSTFPTKPFQHQRAHILGAVPIATQPARAQLGQRRPLGQNIFLTVYAADNSCTGLSGKRKSGPKTGTYSIPSGDWPNFTLVGPKLHTKIIRSSQTFIGFASRMRATTCPE